MISPHQTVINRSKGINRFFNAIYPRIDIKDPPFDPAKIQEHPVMIVCTHRSQADYFLGGVTLYNKGFAHMRFAAGDNLTNLPVVGNIFKEFGAFTVERDSGFERTYIKKLCTQVMSMMEKRQAVILFPEGGRSYTNAMLEIKSGVLGAAVLLQATHKDEDVFLVPMSISYECPPDAPWFTMLLHGKKLRKKGQPFFKRIIGNILYFGADICAFLPYLTGPRTGRTYGEVYIDFDDPVSIRSLVDIEANRVKDARDEFFAHRASMQKVATFIGKRFFALYRILPVHLAAAACSGRSAATVAEVETAIETFIKRLTADKRNLTSLAGLTKQEIAQKGLAVLAKLRVINRVNSAFSIKKTVLIDYFAAPLRDTLPADTPGK